MSAHAQEVAVLLAINIIIAYGAFLPLAAGQFNLGIAGFMAIGGYASAYLSNTYGLPALLTIFIGAFVAGAVALVVAVPVLRTRGIYLALMTFGLGQLVQASILNLDFIGGAAGLPVYDYIGFAGATLLALGVCVFVFLLSGTRFGLVLTAIHDDEAVAEVFGVNVASARIAAFTLGAAIAGLGGALYAHHFSTIEAQHFDVLLSIYVLLYVLLGGVHSVWGPILGAAIFTLMPELLRGAAQWRYVDFAILIVLLMLVRPHGLITQALRFSLPQWRRRAAEG